MRRRGEGRADESTGTLLTFISIEKREGRAGGAPPARPSPLITKLCVNTAELRRSAKGGEIVGESERVQREKGAGRVDTPPPPPPLPPPSLPSLSLDVPLFVDNISSP